MAIIKAPYNFVPLNNKVVYPHWVGHVSHDIPFSDGLSGSIDVKLKAESPIFVRDGIGQEQALKNYQNGIQRNAHAFSNYNGRYFIPSTSIKGMLRNVLEILSFGRMENKVNDHRYALRDLSGAMKDQYLKDFTPDKIHCGWLKKIDGSYILSDCGFPGRISHREIDHDLGKNFSTYFSIGGKFDPKNDYEKSAQKKYKLFGDTNLFQKFNYETENTGRRIFSIDSTGRYKGTLVFTGQPGFRQQKNGKWIGHHLEFIFLNDDAGTLLVPDDVINNFFFAYYEHETSKWSEDWKIWRKKLSQGESIPVFFHKEGENIKSLGLSYLYKLPYENSVVESISSYHKYNKPDLVECIFGHIDKNNALKGRVHIGHAIASQAEVDAEKKEVLSSPKASYYPNYIRQKITNGAVGKYKTFMDKKSEIAGWKRYPVHANGVKHNAPTSKAKSEKILTRFIPLKAGAKFSFTLRYHNLRPVELGALLSSLTFHGTENTYHSIGMAKPLGYGKVKLTISNSHELDIPKYLGQFESYMNAQLDGQFHLWHTLDQVTELVTMAQEQSDTNLNYMNLDEHVLAKNDKFKNKTPKPIEALDRYSVLVSNKAKVTSFCSSTEIIAMKTICEKEVKTYLSKDDLTQIIEERLNSTISMISDELEARRNKLLEQLQNIRLAVSIREHEVIEAHTADERAKKREEAKKQAESEGPGLEEIDISNWRSAKDNLVKGVEDYGKKYHKQSNIKKLLQQYPQGYLPVKFHGQLLNALQHIYSNLPKKEQEKWNLPFPKNAIRKKVAEWVGPEKAKSFNFNNEK